jgi:hypothetical protein
MNFGSLHYFMELKTIENDLKSAAQWWAEIGPWLQRAARQLRRWLARCGVVTTCIPRTGRQVGALVGGLVIASR